MGANMTLTQKPIQEKQELVNRFHNELGKLPETVNGWERDDTEKSIFAYWRAQATHVNGSFEAIVALPRPGRGEAWVVKQSFDRFGHRVNQTAYTSRPPEQADWVWESAERKMASHSGNNEFEQRPSLPETVGAWHLLADHEGRNRETTYDIDFGRAELHVEQVDIESHYSHTRRPHRIWYADIDMTPDEKAVIVDNVPRLSAYEIAVHIMRNFSGNISNSLEEIKGIGPAKSRQLSLLGITTPGDLREYLSDGDSAPNHDYAEAVDKLLTETIREQF